MTQIPDYTPEPMAPAIIVGSTLTLAIVVIIGGYSIWQHLNVDSEQQRRQAHIDAGMKFPPLHIDEARLAAERDRFYQAPDTDLIDDEIDDLHTAYQRANQTQFRSHDPDRTEEAAQAAATLEQKATAVVEVVGPRGFEPVARPHFEACRDGVDDLVEVVRDGELPFAQALEDPPSQRFSVYRNHCGNLLSLLNQYNLIDSDGQWSHPDGLAIVDIFQRYRWASLVRNSYPAHRVVSPHELGLLYRWRIEHDPTLSMSERHDLLEEARPFLPDDYPFELADARLRAASTDDPDQALQYFETLAKDHGDDDFYRNVYDTARRQIRAAQR